MVQIPKVVLGAAMSKHTCSALTTSIMTPPFNIRARPSFTACEFFGLSPFVCVWDVPFSLVGSSVAILTLFHNGDAIADAFDF
jgi:hypothetical protein